MLDEQRTPGSRDRQIDLEVASKLIADGGIFDPEYYRSENPPSAGLTPIEHYLCHGWREGAEPSAGFNGRWLYPYFASAGLHDPPALTYVTLRAAGMPTYPTQDTAERVARIIRSSGFFDAKDYAACAGIVGGLDPILHYVIIGERFGYPPSVLFDPLYYAKRYPHIGLSPTCLLEHYLTFGKKKAYRPLSIASELGFDTSRIQQSRETVLLVDDQAPRADAPVLAYDIAQRLGARYNLVTLALRPGKFLAEYEACSIAVIGPVISKAAWDLDGGLNDVEGEYIARRLNATYPIKFAIVNGPGSFALLKPMACETIPCVTLADEFAADKRHRGRPPAELGRRLEWSNKIAFSAETAANSLLREYPGLVEQPVHILPQAQIEAAPRNGAYRQSSDAERGHAMERAVQAPSGTNAHLECLVRLGEEAEHAMQQRRADLEIIQNDPAFDANMFLEPGTSEATRDEAIRLFLARSRDFSTSSNPTTNFSLRRPCAGFHPQIYGFAHAGQYDTKTINPLAHFIRSGRPSGPWRHDVITPADLPDGAPQATNLRTVIHGHFYYPELISDFSGKLAINAAQCDLLLSTNNQSNADRLQNATRHYDRGAVTIRIFPNRGRDIGPFLTGFADEIAKYDVVGHFHSKRSAHLSDRGGDRWREFLWQNLLGGFYPMADAVIGQLAKDSGLGLIFAEDPHLEGWSLNREIAEGLARKIGWVEPLPPYFDFPIGSMFWARTRALEPLLRLGLKWEDYPKEPAPFDGTLLHAIERLLPFATQAAGFRYATASVPGMTW